MGNGVWISIIGFVALSAVILFIMRDAAKSPVVAAMHEPPQTSSPASLPPPALLQSPGDNWRVSGWLITLGGAVGLTISLFLKTSVEAYMPAMLGAGGTSEVVNLDLLFRKGVAVACSLTAIGAGLFCLAIGAVIAAIHARQV